MHKLNSKQIKILKLIFFIYLICICEFYLSSQITFVAVLEEILAAFQFHIYSLCVCCGSSHLQETDSLAAGGYCFGRFIFD